MHDPPASVALFGEKPCSSLLPGNRCRNAARVDINKFAAPAYNPRFTGCLRANFECGNAFRG